MRIMIDAASGTGRRALPAVAAGVLAFAAVGAAAAQEKIVASGYTGVWFDAQKACIFEPFNAKNSDIVVTTEPGLSSTTLVKLRQQKDNPEIDVAWIARRSTSPGLMAASPSRPGTWGCSTRLIPRR